MPIDNEEVNGLSDESGNATGNPEWKTGDIVTAEKLNAIEYLLNDIDENMRESIKPTLIVIDNDGTLSYPFAVFSIAFEEGVHILVERNINDGYITRLPVLSVGMGQGGPRYVTILDIDNNSPSLTTYFASGSSDYPKNPALEPQ